MDKTLSMLIHAPSKCGKTTLASTAPYPILLLDAEGGSKFLPIRRIHWEPSTGAPPRYDGTWDVCVVIVRDWATVMQVYQWLSYGQHDFNSLVVDSITEIQRRCKQNLVGSEALKIQDWGSLLMQMDSAIRGFRDLTQHPTKPMACVVFIAETRQLNGKWRPSMQGQIVDALPYWVDVCGYLFIDQTLDTNGQPTATVRKLLIQPNALYEAGERVQGKLEPVITEPNITRMMQQIYQ